MSPRRIAGRIAGKIAAATAAVVGAALFSVTGAQAAKHPHHIHMVHHHRAPVAAEVAGEGVLAAAPVVVGGYYEPSAWGDFECVPSYPGCRPYSAKDWSKP